jgi:hypothetical protein
MPSRRTMIRLVLSHAGMAAAGLGLIVSASMMSESMPVQAQTDPTPADALLIIPGPDGEPVSLRSGPAPDQPIVASLIPYEVVSPLGPAHQDGITRWLPVKTASNQVGWIPEQYVAVVGAAPLAVASPEPVVAEAPPPVPAVAEAPIAPPPVPSLAELPPPPAPAASSVPMDASASASNPAFTAAQVPPPDPGKPLEVETKLKYPEARGRHQEITIWVTRDGVPVPGAIVTIFTEDDEDEPMRVLEPTNVDGRTRREFAIGKEKGSIELVVSAVAPDGGKGKATATYFRR